MITSQYIAGLFDGEGCITISPYNRKNKRYDNRYTQLQIVIAMKDIKAVKEICNLYGGKLTQDKNGCHRWRCPTKQRKIFLEDIYPFLIIKKEQAKIGLLYEETILPLHGSRFKLTQEIIETRHKLMLECKRLKFVYI